MESEEGKRSSGCTKRLSKSTSPMKSPPEPENSIRRSPRLCSASAPANEDDGAQSGECWAICSSETAGKCLRRSPRSMCSGPVSMDAGEKCPMESNLKLERCLRRCSTPAGVRGGEPEKRLVIYSPKANLTSERVLRRSPRMHLAPAGVDGGESEKRLLLHSSDMTSEKLIRRSPRLNSTPAGNCSRRSSLRSNSTSEKLVRRSPRLSSAQAGVNCALSQKGSMRRSSRNNLPLRRSPRMEIAGADPDALALTLHVIGSGIGYSEEQEEESPVPLMICHPNMSREKSVRRSPRFTKSASEKVKQNFYRRSPRFSPSTEDIAGTLDCQLSSGVKALLPPERCLRRSPRLSSPTVEMDGLNNLDSVQSVVPRKRKGLPAENCLQRSPRLLPTPSCVQVERPSGALKVEQTTHEPNSKKKKMCVEENCYRTSSRLSLVSVSAQNGSSDCPKLALPAPQKERVELIVSEKALRSRKIEFHVYKKEETEMESVSTETPDKNITTLGNIDSDKSSGKCLRSGKILVAEVGHEGTELLVSGYNDVPATRTYTDASSNKKQRKTKRESFFVGNPVPENEARERWGWRYELKGQRREGQSWVLNAGEEDEIHLDVNCHYLQANIDGCIFSLGDCATIKGEGEQEHLGRILEFFRTSEDESYFRVQWFFRAEDTVMKEAAAFHDKRRLFFSTLMNDNLLECIISKVNVIEIAPTKGLRPNSVEPSEYYYDMEYSVKYSTFRTLATVPDSLVVKCDFSTPSALDTCSMALTSTPSDLASGETCNAELALLDLYAGCGGMSTGLCLGAKLSGVRLVTRWAIDYHKSACDSLKLNHPETQVRHTTAEDFLELLKEWEKLCKSFLSNGSDRLFEASSEVTEESPSDANDASGEFEVSSLVDICYGDPSSTGQHGLKFKVRWKGYGPSEDTWEPIEGLSNCQGHIQDFVREGYYSKILPAPGDVDVICGGPPCQGISGYNRFRNTDDPLTDERNQQIVVFYDIVNFLKPKYVLMENVADIVRFDKASLARYALSRLVHMNYQARLGIMAAGSYGLPQFRLRVFLWGALPCEKLPQFPLPTHEVIVKYYPAAEFEQNTVAYDEGQPRELEEAVVLRDAISDLPAVTSNENREEMTYQMPPETEFQTYIRLKGNEIIGSVSEGVTDWTSSVLYDHRPYQLSEDNYIRVCHIPHRKGANFRDFPGIVVSSDNVVHRDPNMEPVLLPSGNPMVPDCVFTFEKGKSKRPFARVWWDEIVSTVVTFPNVRSQATLHPEQDRVFTIREYARLQGFPDNYRFCGNVKERYCQVGNAVAIPVAKTLGYALGMAFRKLSGDEPLMTLPPNFAFQVAPIDDIVVMS